MKPCCATCMFYIYDWCVKHQENGHTDLPLDTVCDDYEEKKHAETK